MSVRNKIKALVFTTLIATLPACGLLYEPDVQQGNVITQEMLERVEIGMTRSQVEYLLGTPLIEDPFHTDRWDYYYNYRRGRANTQQQTILTMFFKSDQLTEVRGNTDLYNVDADHPAAPDLTDRERDQRTFWERVKAL